ncbi:Sec-independent protein translocase protein TatB [Altererythrobacter sp. C41]|uniref:Sec-independent protein translocase protein TatB n=1 Tax=Altererythrobacter sp. C41 TaxID=2806021 RepID=UPI001934AE55|nr:Sec-independent protein translocase protein TatB [Altererythrobacter sp. C41]MBM0170076.1 twin-arginine translocase subunit TatB [Altererythrobacter sp. C41]
MFDIGATELLVIVIVAVIVIGPKDLPLALRTAGRWIGKIRRVSGHFRTGIETMIREAEMEEMEKKWREQNAKIMAEHPAEAAEPADPAAAPAAVPPASAAESRAEPQAPPAETDEQPKLPLGKPGAE